MSDKWLSGCFGISLAINSWGAIKQSQVPWPGTLIRIGIAFGLIGVVANASEDLADALAIGFLLASLVNLATTQGTGGKWNTAFGALPPTNSTYYTLNWAGASAKPGTTGAQPQQPFIGPVAPGVARPGATG